MLITTPVRYFLEVATQGSVRAASQSLLVAPSAVSRQIGILERELGVQLFRRSTKGMVLTASGHAAQEFFTDSVDKETTFRDGLLGSARIAVPLVRMGVLEGLVSLLPTMTARLNRRSPDTVMNVRVSSSRSIVESLTAGDLDAGFVSGRERLGALAVEHSVGLPLHLVTGPDHELADSSCVGLEQLEHLPLVLADEEFGIRRELDRACESRHVSPRIIGETNSLAGALEMALARGAATVLTLVTLTRSADGRGVRAIPILDTRLENVPLSLVVPRSSPVPDAVRLAAQLGRDLLASPALAPGR